MPTLQDTLKMVNLYRYNASKSLNEWNKIREYF